MNDPFAIVQVALSILCLLVTVVLLIVFIRSRNQSKAESATREEFRLNREEASKSARDLREELTGALTRGNDTIGNTLLNMGNLQQSSLSGFAKQIEETNKGYGILREEVLKILSAGIESLSTILAGISKVQQDQLAAITKELKELTAGNQIAIDGVKEAVNGRLREIQELNERKLEDMRKTVDEKLHGTLERRLGESFKIVSDRLEAVQRGLGEMQGLATGVGDLKRVLTNVKARGTWAEVQLGAILEQTLTNTQFDRNVRVKDDSSESVEYAIRLPGPKSAPEADVWLPIDSKFPQEDYVRLQEAADRSDPDAVLSAVDSLIRAIRVAARDIRDKYINPPKTTDFAIMFLATEGLYAEVIRQPALVDELSRTFRVVVAGPTTLSALLSSLRMGFQTLAIEQRASEVWNVLAAVKTEFGKFGEVLDKVKKQLSTATKTIEETGVRTRAMERKLRSVEELPAAVASEVLALPTNGETHPPCLPPG